MLKPSTIFQFLKDDAKHFVFATAFVDIRLNKYTGKPFINTTDWVIQSLGFYDDADLQDEICNIEPLDYDVTKEGYYELQVLFRIHTDDNGVGHYWNYLEPEEIEINFAISIEEYEQEIEDTNKSVEGFDMLFGIMPKTNDDGNER